VSKERIFAAMDAEESRGPLQDRIAVVSGGAQGIGRSIAQHFQRAGARVFIVDRDAPAGLQTAAELTASDRGRPVEFLAADLRRADQIHDAVGQIKDLHGRVDILVNNAGIEIEKSFESTTIEDWDQILGVNLRGAFLLTQAALALFSSDGGAIINISSIHATHAFADSLPYACSKAGLIAFTRNLALELAPRRIRVNAICPGYIDTRLWEEYLRRAPDPSALDAATTALHPLGRRGLPADVADAVVFLSGDSASFVTGTTLVVDGGLTIRAHP
jgi:NAD(P)-dependent dehydrogenase (short-subunit alcohol dehydrogenase family)